MQNKGSDEQNEHQFRRAVSLEPTMAAPEGPTDSATTHVNPMFNSHSNDANDGNDRTASVRRQHSEPTRNRHQIQSSVSKTESFKNALMRGTQHILGINEENDTKEEEIWTQRRQRMISNFGKLKQREMPRSRVAALPTGLDVVDGVSHTNNKIGFSDNERQAMNTITPEVSARKPALQVSLKAMGMVSDAIKNKFKKRNQNNEIQIQMPFQSPEVQPLRQQSVEPSYSADMDYHSPTEQTVESPDDFFVFPGIHGPPEEEVDSRRRAPNMWTIERQVSVKEQTLSAKIIETLLSTDNSNRREVGFGIIDRLLDRRLKKNLTKEQMKAIDHMDDSRPYFTYWITTVQILVLIISISVYGFGYYGFDFARVTGLVFTKSLSLQQVDYDEPQNFWGGPRSADLIHLGAKYTPCMRRDDRIYNNIESERRREGETGCCIRNDGSGCVQTSFDKCSTLLSTWHKWTHSDSNPLARTSGPVCGQDPQYCEQPASIDPYIWADDITKWPVCLKQSAQPSYSAKHMQCELIARPCCLGVYGQCHITTREFCNFIKGFFHEEATLCSQVSCMKDVCGMIGFYSDDTPDQFYRIWMPIFLHAGFGHLLITVFYQFFIMRNIEKLTGTARISTIYMFSGIGGYLASAVFLPSRPEVGPAGSLYGIFACLFVEVYNTWSFIEDPMKVLMKLIAVVSVLFVLGFVLPWIDNYAHIMGFIIGSLLSLALMPYNQMQRELNERKQFIQKIICLAIVVIIFIVLLFMLYFVPIYDINIFKYINCIPITRNWCSNQDIHFNKVDVL